MKKNVSLAGNEVSGEQNAEVNQAASAGPGVTINVPDVSDQTKNKKQKLAIDIDLVKEEKSEKANAAAAPAQQ